MTGPEVVLRARIVRVKKTGIHSSVRGPLPVATRIEVERDGDSYFVIRYDESDAFGGDTWHASLEGALEQLNAEYEWERVEPQKETP